MNKMKRAVAETMGMFFAEHGLMTLKEYKSLKRVPVRIHGIRRAFGSYKRMLTFIERSNPELWNTIVGSEVVEATEVKSKMAIDLAEASQIAAEIAAAGEENKGDD